MHQPAHFREERLDVMHGLMRQYPFAGLIALENGSLSANHLPLALHPELSAKGTLRGHVARGNSLWQQHDPSHEALAIFQGPQHYVTPSWYGSKEVHGRVVPSWNYAVVHAYGALKIVQDSAWIAAHLTELTSRHEADRTVPWKPSDAPEDYIDGMMKGLVGIEFAVSRLEGKWKVSQNRNAEDRNSVIKGLSAERDDNAIAISDIMKSLEE